jgi:2-(1,2-epoxy-1,2-dihydrophenyl)acetyl-CoA isomerase
MTNPSMRVERDGALARLIFTQAERGNPIDAEFCDEFARIADEISEDRSIRALLITAEGKHFSFGGDVRKFQSAKADLPKLIKEWTRDLHVGIARLQRMDAPIVAAIQGICTGGMNGVMAGSDVIVIEPATRFVAAYAAIGYSNDASSSVMFARRMGIARAKRFLIMNEILDAEAALAAGLADEIVPADNLVAKAEEIARRLAEGPTRAFGEIRRLLNTVGEQPLETQLELEAQALARIARTADAQEGLTAFVEKRKPVFRGE